MPGCTLVLSLWQCEGERREQREERREERGEEEMKVRREWRRGERRDQRGERGEERREEREDERRGGEERGERRRRERREEERRRGGKEERRIHATKQPLAPRSRIQLQSSRSYQTRPLSSVCRCVGCTLHKMHKLHFQTEPHSNFTTSESSAHPITVRHWVERAAVTVDCYLSLCDTFSVTELVMHPKGLLSHCVHG